MSNEDNIYKKHQANLHELDRVTKKMQNFLLTDEFENDDEPLDQSTNKNPATKYQTYNNSLADTHSSLGREREHDAIHIIHKLDADCPATHAGQNDLFNQSARLRQELSQAVQFADTLKVHDLEHTAVSNHSQPHKEKYQDTYDEHDIPQPTRDMIQNVNFDIDNFITNARIIQDSINEAMTYTTDIDPNIKEEMFRSDLKLRAQNLD